MSTTFLVIDWDDPLWLARNARSSMRQPTVASSSTLEQTVSAPFGQSTDAIGQSDPASASANAYRTASAKSYTATPIRPVSLNTLPISTDASVEESATPSRTEVGTMIERRLAELKVYVLESEITEAQESVKSIVRQASF